MTLKDTIILILLIILLGVGIMAYEYRRQSIYTVTECPRAVSKALNGKSNTSVWVPEIQAFISDFNRGSWRITMKGEY